MESHEALILKAHWQSSWGCSIDRYWRKRTAVFLQLEFPSFESINCRVKEHVSPKIEGAKLEAVVWSSALITCILGKFLSSDS